MSKQLFFAVVLQLTAQLSFSKQSLGPRLTAMGRNGAAITDVWNVGGNPAASGWIKSSTVSLNYTSYLPDTELGNQALAVAIPLKRTTIGFGLNKHGVPELYEISISPSLGKKFGDHLSIGLRINCHQLKIQNYGSTGGFSIDIGAFYRWAEQLKIGFYINNPAFQYYSNSLTKIEIPSSGYAGISYELSKKVLLGVTISKTKRTSADIGIGLEYHLVQSFTLRTGVTLNPFRQYAGVGVEYQNFSLDFATESDPNIGTKPQIGLSYAF